MAPWLEYTQAQIDFMSEDELKEVIIKARDMVEELSYEDRMGYNIDYDKLTKARNILKMARSKEKYG